MSELEIIVSVFIVALGLFTAGHIIGYHRGWQDGYWTPHPGGLLTESVYPKEAENVAVLDKEGNP